jgi:hypothetical protein
MRAKAELMVISVKGQTGSKGTRQTSKCREDAKKRPTAREDKGEPNQRKRGKSKKQNKRSDAPASASVRHQDRWGNALMFTDSE